MAELTDPWRGHKVPLWNSTFNMSYPRFRHRVGEIAALNHSRVEGASTAEWNEIADGALVMPVDDDDWFAPNAARVLEAERDPAVPGYIWRHYWIQVPIDLGHRVEILRRRLLSSAREKWVCGTNNYAFPKGSETKELLGNHLRASRWLEGPVI